MMTRKDAYEIIEEVKNKICSRKYATEQSEAFDIALELLKQESYKDAVSRSEIINRLKGFERLHNEDELRTNLIDMIWNLPPVNP